MSNVEREPVDAADGAAMHGAWELENSPYTIEGEIEGFARFGTGVRRSHGWQRAVGLILVLSLVGPMVYGVLRFLVMLIF